MAQLSVTNNAFGSHGPQGHRSVGLLWILGWWREPPQVTPCPGFAQLQPQALNSQKQLNVNVQNDQKSVITNHQTPLFSPETPPQCPTDHNTRAAMRGKALLPPPTSPHRMADTRHVAQGKHSSSGDPRLCHRLPARPPQPCLPGRHPPGIPTASVRAPWWVPTSTGCPQASASTAKDFDYSAPKKPAISPMSSKFSWLESIIFLLAVPQQLPAAIALPAQGLR